jgi:hypothetical protein
MMYVAFTGHRPKDLPPEYQGWRERNELVFANTQRLFDAIEAKRGTGYLKGIHVGGALGIDTAVAMAYGATMLKCHLHLPYTVPTMAARWREWDRRILEQMVSGEAGDRFLVCQTCPEPGPYAGPEPYDRRNHHMVDSADLLAAFWTGKRQGGTWNAIAYAHKVGKPVVNLIHGRIEVVHP